MTDHEIMQNLLNGETLVTHIKGSHCKLVGNDLEKNVLSGIFVYDWIIKPKTKKLSADDVRSAFFKLPANKYYTICDSYLIQDLIKELGL